jgi:hypothetical protein
LAVKLSYESLNIVNRRKKMKKTSLFLVVALAAALALHAQNVPAGLRYEDEGSGVRITGYTGTAKDLTLPGRIDGKNVTVIGSRAFSDNRTLESVILPNRTTTIETEAFVGCIALQSVTMPDSVTTIERSAFGNCIALKTITWPADLVTIGQNAFRQCSSLGGSVTFPASLATIGERAFSGTSLTSVTIPQGAQVGANAFQPNTAIVAPLSAAASLLVGTWRMTAGYNTETFVFNADGTGAYKRLNKDGSGKVLADVTDPIKWTASGNVVTITFDDGQGGGPENYSISGNTLTLSRQAYTRQ